jgi:hypothetical protein
MAILGSSNKSLRSAAPIARVLLIPTPTWYRPQKTQLFMMAAMTYNVE